LGFTQRLIVIGAVVAVLAVSFVSSLSVYLRQQHDIAETKHEIAMSQDAVSDLQDRIARWQDPAYVEAQARDRLGWVMPGEIGYRVVDGQGNVIGGVVSAINPKDDAATRVWYEALWGSLQAADRPEPIPAETASPSGPTTVGPDSTEPPR
jgi:cell division protein FtsB